MGRIELAFFNQQHTSTTYDEWVKRRREYSRQLECESADYDCSSLDLARHHKFEEEVGLWALSRCHSLGKPR